MGEHFGYFGRRPEGYLADEGECELVRICKVYSCNECAALVADREAHARWHESELA